MFVLIFWGFVTVTFKSVSANPSQVVEKKKTAKNPLVDIFYSALSIQVCPEKGITPTLHSYSKDGIRTLIPILGRGLDS